jgi:hypothetical protein
MKLIAYVIEGHRLDIRPAPVERGWMDATNQRYAYRCLPLDIANAHGWEVLCPSAFVAAWSGGPQLEAIQVQSLSIAPPPATSHFGHGTLTFHLPCIFRTEPGFDLMVQGPINRPKDGIAALSGIIETDWAPYTFTMNWVFTRPGRVGFAEGEPFCHVFPIRRGELEDIEPQQRPLAAEPELERQYKEWTASRSQFNKDLKQPGSQAQAERWQKRYYQGLDPDGQSTIGEEHRTRLRLRPFDGR